MNSRRSLVIAALLFSCACLFAQTEDGGGDEAVPGTKLWSFRTRGPIFSSPALNNDGTALYVGSGDGRLYCFDTAGGNTNWVLKLGGGVASSPLVSEDGTIYVGADNGILYSITDNGPGLDPTVNWRFRTRGAIRSSPAMDEDGNLYVGSRDNFMYSVFSDGAKRWAFDAGHDVVTSPVIDGENLYFGSSLTLFGLSLEGSQESAFTLKNVILSTPAVAVDGTIYFGANDERIYALHSGSGSNSVRWAINTKENVLSSPAIGASGRVYIGSDNHKVYCLSTNGAVLWKYTTRGPVRAPVSLGADGTVYVGCDDHRLYAIAADGTLRWRYRTRGIIRSSPTIGADGTVYVTSMDRSVYAIADNAISDESPWPMFRRDRQHSARATNSEIFIIEQPQSTNINAGETAVFTVQATSASPLTYQWLKDGEEIDPDVNRSAATATLTITNAQPSDAGQYSVVVSNEFAEVTSESATLIVSSAPVFVNDLTNRVVAVGSVTTLSVTVLGDPPITYHWFRNGVALNETNRAYTFTNDVPATNTYFVQVTNPRGTTNSHTITVAAVALVFTSGTNSVISAGNRFSAAVVSNQLFTWGADLTGQLGDGGVSNRVVPTRTSLTTDWASVAAGGRGFTQGSNVASAHTLAIRAGGDLYAWGANSRGQLGIGSTNDQRTPVHVGADTNWVMVEAGAAHSVGLKKDGSMWTWGANDFGQLGLGTTNFEQLPVQVAPESVWLEVRAGGSFTLARRGDNTIWAWGRNDSGQLGITNTTLSRVPVQVGTASDWTTISAGVAHSLGVRADGTLWMWGRDFGVVFNNIYGTTNNVIRVPTRVGDATNWRSISAGYDHNLAINSDNHMFAWGANDVGQLGNGRPGPATGVTNSENQATPIAIATDRTWVSIDAGVKHSVAQATDGSIWAWGWNSAGQVGDGTEVNRSTPVLLVFTNFTTVITNIGSTGPPLIIAQPQPTSVASLSNAVFNVTLVGMPPLAYQWRFNSNAISGATNAQLTIVAAQTTNAGAYDVIVTNTLGSVTSIVATLIVTNNAPIILTQPTARSVVTNGITAFSVTVTGTPPFSFQWRHGGTEPLPAGTNSVLILTNVTLDQAGYYDVVVLNAFGKVTSIPAFLTVTTNSSINPFQATSSAAALPSVLKLSPVVVTTEGVVVPVSEARTTFILEYKTRMEDPEWIPLSTNDGVGSLTNLIDKAVPGTSRYYRLRVP